MESDICIRKIENMYYARQKNWHRDFFAPRKLDGLVFFEEGSIEYHFADKTVLAKKGDILALPGNLPYSGKRYADEISIFVIDFSCGNENEFEHLLAPAAFTPMAGDLVHAKFARALQAWERQAIDVQLELKSLIYSLLCEAFRNPFPQKNTTPTDDILEFILKNLDDPELSVFSLCQRFSISESQLRRNIIKATNATPNRYILTLRMKKAMNELAQSEKSIQQVAIECGFSSPYYFSRCFSQHVGISPSEYKNSGSWIH